MQQNSLNNLRPDCKLNCDYSRLCGGCFYAGKSYSESADSKQKTIGKLLKGLPVSVLPIITAKNPFNYRNKVHAAFGTSKGGKIICGMYEKSSHRIVENPGCSIENKNASEIIETIKNLAQSFRLPVYDEKRRTGVLRRVLIRTADNTGEILVVLVVGNKVFPGKNNFVKELVKRHPEITSIVVNTNLRSDSMILGDRSDVAYGKGFIIDELCGLKFKISPESFYQINHDQTELLYAQAIAVADLSPEDKIIDAYCGIGTIGLAASKYCGRVTGVELNPHAVKDARNNAEANKITNARFICGDAGEFMVNASLKNEKYDVVFLDPPRSGTTEAFIKACHKLSPRKVVYVSCNPETLARDLPVFMEYGYEPVTAAPVDMFPWTDSIETVVLLERKLDFKLKKVIHNYRK